MITGIVVALPEELSTLTANKLAKGTVARLSDNILVIYSGAGRKNASSAAELLVAQGVDQLISWGCAAALDALLKPGDLVLANSCIGAELVGFDLNNKDWLIFVKARLEKPPAPAVHSYIGLLAESKSIAASSQDKTQLAKATSAMALDMESTAIARVAQSHGLPFLSIRAIADPLNMDLPKAVTHALNNQGDVVLSKLLAYLLWHPAELPGLIKLGLAFNAARKTLRQVAKQLDVLTMPSLTHTIQLNNNDA